MADQSNEMGMVERVAAAIYGNAWAFDMSEEHAHVQEHYRDMARAAIEAMREPTTEMCWAMSKNGAEGNDDELRSDWSAAVDAALSHDEVKG